MTLDPHDAPRRPASLSVVIRARVEDLGVLLAHAAVEELFLAPRDAPVRPLFGGPEPFPRPAAGLACTDFQLWPAERGRALLHVGPPLSVPMRLPTDRRGQPVVREFGLRLECPDPHALCLAVSALLNAVAAQHADAVGAIDAYLLTHGSVPPPRRQAADEAEDEEPLRDAPAPPPPRSQRPSVQRRHAIAAPILLGYLNQGETVNGAIKRLKAEHHIALSGRTAARILRARGADQLAS